MWTAGIWTALALSGIIGLSLGLIGSGGSIITLPILVYVAGMPVREAVPLSLVIVGSTAAIGAVVQTRRGLTEPDVAAIFGVAGIAGALVGAQFTALVPGPALLLIFAAILLVVGSQVLFTRGEVEEPRPGPRPLVRCGVAGAGVGVLTGFLGIGGGFLIMPALIRFARLPIRQAIGTSLVVIALNSAAGGIAHWSALRGHLVLALLFVAAALFGMAVGLALGPRMRPGALRLAFGGLALSVALFLIVRNVGALLGLIG